VAGARSAPVKPAPANQAEMQRVFGAAQNAFPETPRHYQIYFLYDSTELTAESKLAMKQVVAAIETHNSVEIGVIGHADSFGKKPYNQSLSERRAHTIARMLTEMGVRQDLIVSTSAGENIPAVPTADNVKESKNRRVEITIR
ncbi:MAG: OmpA family protein, partial [Gammaproteobacteria bacterium]|nr:OmpA family protein [Gammaproteobacteria bacterium]